MMDNNLKTTLGKFWNKAKQTFALKAELAQPDWNQNDDTQPDYVNNRTHWEEPEIYNEVFSGENLNYTLSGNLTSYQVNSNIPILSEGRHYELNIGEYKFDGICKKYENVAGSYGYYIGNGSISIQGEPDTGEDFIVYTSGRTLSSPEIMWFIMKNDSPSGEYDTLLALHEGGVHRLDKKFLPDDVVYDDDIAQPDWNQNDPEAPDHIKNRTHWEIPETVIMNKTFPAPGDGTVFFNLDIPLIAGELYTVAIQGLPSGFNTTEEIVAAGDSDGVYLSNSKGLEIGYSATGFPSGYNAYYTGIGANYGEVVTITKSGELHQLDEKFIPNTITRNSDLAPVATSGDYDDLDNKPSIPSKTSDLTNDGSDGTSAYVEGADLAPVATTGDYDDLENAPTKLSDFINDGNGGSPADPFITDSEVSAVGKSGDYGDLLNAPTKLSDFINDGNGDSPSNPFATEADIEEIQDVMSPLASNQNKLISQSEAQDLVNTLSLSPIMADSTGQKSFDFESQMYSALVPGSTNLEAGPWYKNEGNGFVACNSTTGVYVSLNDSAVVTNDESLFFYFTHGYRYQRVKMGVQGVYGQIKTPYGETVNLIYTDGSSLSGKFANVPCIYFYDDHNLFGHTGRVIYVCQVSNLVSKINAAEEYLMAAGETIDDIAAGTDPDNVTDLIYPTTKYVCTQAQTASTDPVWSFRVIISETTFTTAEWEAIRSEITREKVAQIDVNKQAIESLADVAFSGDYDDLDNKLEVAVSQSTYGTNPKYKRTTITVNGTSTNVDVPTVDAELSPSSKNPVQNNVIQYELSTKLSADRFNELDNKALTTDGIKTGIILEPDVTITTGKWYPVYPVVNDYQWKMGTADNDTHFKIYDVSDYDVVHLQAVSRIGYILTDSLPTDFESRVTTTGSGNIWEYNEPSGTAPGTHSEQAVMQPHSGYDIFDGDIITNGRPYLIVYEGNSTQALVVSYGGGYTPITTSMFVNDGEGGSPVDKFAKVSELPTKTSDLINDGEGGSPANPFLKSSDMEASQAEWNYIMGN